jgi:site-specific recombinase XerD
VADNIAPDDWQNPAKKIKLHHPQVRIRPLSKQQIRVLLSLVDTTARSEFFRIRNRAMLLVMLDGAIRVSELIGAERDNLHEDNSLRVLGKGNKERVVVVCRDYLGC